MKYVLLTEALNKQKLKFQNLAKLSKGLGGGGKNKEKEE